MVRGYERKQRRYEMKQESEAENKDMVCWAGRKTKIQYGAEDRNSVDKESSKNISGNMKASGDMRENKDMVW